MIPRKIPDTSKHWQTVIDSSVKSADGPKVGLPTAPALAAPHATRAAASRPFRLQRPRYLEKALSRTGCRLGLPACLVFRYSTSRRRCSGLLRPAIQSVAVLPLKNLSGDPSQEYFSDSMTDELITQLAKISSLKVPSAASVVRYKNTAGLGIGDQPGTESRCVCRR